LADFDFARYLVSGQSVEEVKTEAKSTFIFSRAAKRNLNWIGPYL
jgi:hypothetical protein